MFAGYYTAPDGTGTQYYSAAMESARNWDTPANIELIAHWVYAVGSIGPAGGIVFYDKGEYTDGWRYLEAWTADEGTYQWKTSMTFTPGTSTDVGSGYANTYSAMINELHPAAQVVRNATHGGYSDWFLPSKDELDLMYQNLHGDGIGGFVANWYWSSSLASAGYAWSHHFGNGSQLAPNTTAGDRVRAVRAF